MATPNRSARPAVPRAPGAQSFPFEKTLKDALALLRRFREAEGFRDYLRRRMSLVAPAAALGVLTSLSCAAAMIIFLAERHPLLALPGMVLAPFVLVGSLFVLAYVFLTWLEGRAISQALGKRKKTKLDFGKPPRVPWALAALFLVLPLAVLAAVSGTTALVLILLAVGVVLLFAKFDR